MTKAEKVRKHLETANRELGKARRALAHDCAEMKGIDPVITRTADAQHAVEIALVDWAAAVAVAPLGSLPR